MRTYCLHSLLGLFIKVLLWDMSQSFDMIGVVDDNKETFKLGVQVVDLWFDQEREKSSHLEMVLMDGKVCSYLAFTLFDNVTGFMLYFDVVPEG